MSNIINLESRVSRIMGLLSDYAPLLFHNVAWIEVSEMEYPQVGILLSSEVLVLPSERVTGRGEMAIRVKLGTTQITIKASAIEEACRSLRGLV